MKTDNEIIAEFMGLKPERYRLTPFHKYRIYWCWESGIGVVEEMLGYDKSWAHLMPVVDKIEAIEGLGFIIEMNRVTVTLNNYFWNSGTTTESKFTIVYFAVVEFIKWHNSNHPNQ